MYKMIIVYLDTESLFKAVSEEYNDDEHYWYMAVTYKEFLTAIKNEEKRIATPMLEAIDSKYYELGYDIKVCSNNKVMRFSDVINKNNKYTDREIRFEHDWRRLVLNGEFNEIEVIG